MMFDDLNSAVLNTFAEPFTYHGFNGDVLMQGVFSDEDEQQALAHASFTDRRYLLHLSRTDVDARSIEKHMTVTVNNIRYQILKIDQDLTGMAVLVLKRYQEAAC